MSSLYVSLYVSYGTSEVSLCLYRCTWVVDFTATGRWGRGVWERGLQPSILESILSSNPYWEGEYRSSYAGIIFKYRLQSGT